MPLCGTRNLMKMDGHKLDCDHQYIVDKNARTRSQAPYFQGSYAVVQLSPTFRTSRSRFL